MMCDCCSLRGVSGVGMAVRAPHFSAVKFVVRLSAPVPRGRNYIGMPLVSICSRRGHEGLLCKFSAAFISVAIVVVTVVAFPWPAPSADAATSDFSVPLGETSAQISYVRNTEGSDTVTDLAGGYYYSTLPWQWAAARACIRYSPAGGDYSTSVVKGGGQRSLRHRRLRALGAQRELSGLRGRLLLGRSVLPGVPALQHHVHQSRPGFSCRNDEARQPSHLLRYQCGHQPGQA